MNKDILCASLSLSLSLSVSLSLSLCVCVLCSVSPIRKFFFTTNYCVTFCIDGLVGIREMDVLLPDVGHHSNTWNTTFCFLFAFEETEKREEEERFCISLH